MNRNIFLLLFLLSILLPVSLKAQADSGVVRGFTLTPAKFEISLAPGESVIRNLYVTNNATSSKNFKVEVEDVAGSRDLSEVVKFYGKGFGPYSIKNSILIDSNNFELEAGETHVIPVMIPVAYNALPGGLYGTVLVTAVNDNSMANARISTRVGSLFFVRVKGETRSVGALKTFSVTKPDNAIYFSNKPVSFDIAFENSGNIYLNTYGYISLVSLFGKEVGKIELPPTFAFPDSVRLRQVSWLTSPAWGIYKATVYLNRGYEDVIDKKTIWLVFIPAVKIIVGVIAVLILWFIFKKKRDNLLK